MLAFTRAASGPTAVTAAAVTDCWAFRRFGTWWAASRPAPWPGGVAEWRRGGVAKRAGSVVGPTLVVEQREHRFVVIGREYM